MQKLPSGSWRFSATDLIHFLECEHLTALDRTHAETPLDPVEDDAYAALIQAKGFEHEKAFARTLEEQAESFVDISRMSQNVESRFGATCEAMRAGTHIIYQGTLIEGDFLGHADFLRRVETPSALGPFSYELLDTKLARSPKAKFVIQLGMYCAMLKAIQGISPALMHVILGDGNEASFRVADYADYVERLKARFLSRVLGTTFDTYPEPCSHCDLCRWHKRCSDTWASDDHLSLVANIQKSQIKKLQGVGVDTLAALARLDPQQTIPGIAQPVLNRLSGQAGLQLDSRITGDPKVKLIHFEEAKPGSEIRRGFARMPKPDEGDLFFDMEGDPFTTDGLEYLFGLYYMDKGEPIFTPFWAHDRLEERHAFEQLIDFISERLRQYPKAHIYHYAAYEASALKKLMGLHGTREAEVDALLRGHKLVDLYRVVRESIQVSEPAYSIKNLERFYAERRAGTVQNAGGSVIAYEAWKQTGLISILDEIAAYNRDDVISTYKLRQWLLSLRPLNMPWANSSVEAEPPQIEESSDVAKAQRRLAEYRDRLCKGLVADESVWDDDDRHRELTFHLLGFQRRAAKPQWWAIFERQVSTVDDRFEDPECIAGLIEQVHEPIAEARSLRYTYRYPEQEFKLKSGDACMHVDTLWSLQDLRIDEHAKTVSFKLGAHRLLPPGPIDIGAAGPARTTKLEDATYRYADSVLACFERGEPSRYPALDAILKRDFPRFKGLDVGAPLTKTTADVQAIAELACTLNHSYLIIQGPPGTGKTYSGSRLIVELLKAGKRVGVSSNSHKAIINLLHAVEDYASRCGVSFRGAKKSGQEDPAQHVNGQMIVDVWNNAKLFNTEFQLIAGTAWLFAEPSLDQSLDYLVVDEAGQVSLGMLVPMATSARNLILLGDQMQLSQPVQGTHPKSSGASSLEHLLQDRATICAERGIFLSETRRLHPDICRFISDAVYDGRLLPHPDNVRRTLVLGSEADAVLKPSGICIVPMSHHGCSQSSMEEVERIKSLYANLLGQRYTDDSGVEHDFTARNILVVSPYNLQVKRLEEALPNAARIGTVDKFQGQEAEVVIISMATSSGDDLPRHIEFLYSKNRINVAVSRARCLAVLVVNPALLDIRCQTVEQMMLVNTLCWIFRYASDTAVVDRNKINATLRLSR